MKNFLLASVIAGLIVLTGFIASETVDDSEFDLSIPFEDLDTYPEDDLWSNTGTHDNTVTDEGSLVIDDVSEEEGRYTSDNFMKNSSVVFDQLILDSSIDEDESAELVIQYLNDDEEAVEVQNIELEDGHNSYEIEDNNRTYSGYSFQIDLETTENTSPSIEKLSVSYEGLQSLTGDVNLSDLIFWITMILGMVIALVGVASVV